MLYTDSLVDLFYSRNNKKNREKDISWFGFKAGHSVDIVFNDRTSSQLKGSGSLRLLRKKDVTDSILQYWSNQIRIGQIHERFEAFRMEQRKTGWKTFNWHLLNYYALTENDNRLSNFSDDRFSGYYNKERLIEFMNVTTNLYNLTFSQLFPELKTQRQLAINLILLIEKRYHL